MTRITVSLDKIKIFGHHGLHPEETRAGAEFEVDMHVEYEVGNRIESIETTVDYTVVYSIVRRYMNSPYALLETLCMDIVEETKRVFPQVTGINITIRKINPPVVNLRGQLSVTVHKRFE